ncbi:XRE family transcriptional regulator [Enterovibrio norvegicus FF-162]|uniref:XRE family transcriptional regulator n=1 Tax=Enterovibrio norvegicus FF-454 TaxID=1185651 RepID=A0A1E5CA90_9GAMM|nr:LysR substrate-binding domain-containing protein [Enterovibrio norvegicus]OEE62395.1 XRE family transcriptional regulator [Enterovibrio norvegicus FF-454]OEE75069.1 XRE family transcriptional regulator [Enterovibrio norvegicus FF-162]
MSVSLRQLQVFVAVAQEKTITAASALLFLSKPAVSMAISELEKQIGHNLFERVNNRLLINEHGKRLLPLADELLTRSDEIIKVLDTTGELSGHLRIGASDTIGNQLVPFLLRDFRNQSNHVDQELMISNSQTIIHGLMAFELDIGLIEGQGENKHLLNNTDLLMEPWLSDEMCIACAVDHPLVQESTLTLFDLEEHPWILRETGSGTREHFLSRMAPRLEHWNIAFELRTTEAIINCAAAGLGLAYLSKLAARHAVSNNRLHLLDIPLDLRRQYWLVRHKDKHLSPLLNQFITFSTNWQISG